MNIEKFVNSKAFAFFDWLLKLLLLNILTTITSIGIITFLPSLIACFQSIKDYKDGSNKNVFSTYFSNFKDCFKRSIGISILFIVITIILYISLMYYYQNIDDMGDDVSSTWIAIFSIGRYLSLFGLFIILLIFIQLPIIYTYFYFRTFDNLRFAFYVAFKYISNSLLCIIPWALSVLTLFYLKAVWFFIGFSLPLYLIYIISRPTYWKIINQSQQNEGEEDNEIRD